MTEQIIAADALLRPHETTVVPASTGPIVIRDFFKRANGVRFSTIFAEFKRRFFDKTEKPASATTYRRFELLRSSPDGPIIDELGGEKKVEGTVRAAFSLLQRQGAGRPGFLRTDGFANIFYARDKNQTLCAMRIGWAEDGWVLDAIPVQDPVAWNGKHEIFCPVEKEGASFSTI